MQETYRKYSRFKTDFKNIFSYCCVYQLLIEKILNFFSLDCWGVFCGTNPETEVDYLDAFTDVFTKESCIA